MQNLKKILQQENVSLIDVRHPWEFDEGHITALSTFRLTRCLQG